VNRQIIRTDQAPAAIGPYSQGVVANGFLFTAGQIPLTPSGQLVEGDIQAQAQQCLENVRGILQEAGADVGNLVKITVFVTDLGDFEAINEVYDAFFKEETPLCQR